MLMEQPRTFAQAVQTQLSADILAGRLPPGTRLRLQSLCKTYDVSMSPLREALATLAGMGLVVQEVQRGFRVAPASCDDLRDVTETRVKLETMALRLAMERGGPDWEASILAAHHRLARNPRTTDRLIDETWEGLHRTFHMALIAACGLPRLLSFCDVLHNHFDRYRRIAVLRARRHPTLRSRHADMVDAVLAKQWDRAPQLLEEHIGESTDQIIALLGQDGFAALSPDPE